VAIVMSVCSVSGDYLDGWVAQWRVRCLSLGVYHRACVSSTPWVVYFSCSIVLSKIQELLSCPLNWWSCQKT
jgi:hypothetical protein